MQTETLDRVVDEPEAVFYDADDEQISMIHGPRSGVGNRWFNALPSLNIEVLVGLPNSYSGLWVNVPDVYPPSAEDVELQQRGYAQLTDPKYSQRLDKFLDNIREMIEEEETNAA